MARVAGEFYGTEIISSTYGMNWRVERAQRILRWDGDDCDSPTFEFCGGHWTLKMIRSVHRTRVKCLSIQIKRHSTSSHKNDVEYEVIKVNSDGAKHVLGQRTTETGECIWEDGVIFVFNGRDFSWFEETPFDLQVVCTLECFECRSEEWERFLRLKRETQDLVIENVRGEGGDLRISVKDKLFKVHKSVMRQRSPVFDMMFRHDLIERKTGEVNITDCEPEGFHKFLIYLYSNELEIDSMDTVYKLYPITDKYEVSEAKAGCVKYMLENLDLETFCDIVILSLSHVDSELSERANQFFEVNSEAITRTRRWKAFHAKNPDAANGFLTRVGS